MGDDVSAEPEQLLAQAREGDRSALGRLLELHRGYCSLLARVQLGRRLQGKLDPGDVVQDVFLKVHRDFPTFRGESTAEFTAWIRQILATSLAGLVRRYLGTRQRDPRLEFPLEQGEPPPSDAADDGFLGLSTPSEHFARKESAARLADALGHLPAHYREVIVLHNLEGLSLVETARRLGRTDDAVQKIWTRALLRLRELLRDPHESGRKEA